MRLIKLAALALAASLSVAAAPPRANWVSTTAASPAGHIMGNPAAELKVAEYVSYTCSHCSQFQIASEAPLTRYFIPSGKVSVEVRHLVRDPVDLTAAMLANCGDPAKFFRVHSIFLRTQATWIGPLEKAGEAQRRRWSSGDPAARRRAIASDLGFYPIMQRLGYTRTGVDRCLANEALARRLAAQTQDAVKQGVAGTPSFMLNGDLLAGTHDWRSLETQLRARL